MATDARSITSSSTWRPRRPGTWRPNATDWPGDCAGFPAGNQNGHQLVNRSAQPARYLEMSNRDPKDTAAYPDEDLALERLADGRFQYSRKDGTLY